MPQHNPFLTTETESLKETYAALNRNDIPGFIKIFAPQIERIEFENSPQAGTYRGLAEVTAHVSNAREKWAEGSCTPERFAISGNRIIVSVYVRVRLKHETDWREGRVTDAFTFQDGKVTEFRSFFNEQQALEWAHSGWPSRNS